MAQNITAKFRSKSGQRWFNISIAIVAAALAGTIYYEIVSSHTLLPSKLLSLILFPICGAIVLGIPTVWVLLGIAILWERSEYDGRAE